jgi:hypothetical protein
MLRELKLSFMINLNLTLFVIIFYNTGFMVTFNTSCLELFENLSCFTMLKRCKKKMSIEFGGRL